MNKSTKDRLIRLKEAILDLIFVPLCPVCGEPSKIPLCPDCKAALDKIYHPLELYKRDMVFDSAVSVYDFDNEAVNSLV